MKKGFQFFLFLFMLLYLKTGYVFLMQSRTNVDCPVSGSLSDIADEVSMIPLENPEGQPLQAVTQVKRDRNDLFILSNKELFHCDCSGKYIGKLSFFNPYSSLAVPITDFVIDVKERQIIAIDREGIVYYADYTGKTLDTTCLPSHPAEHYPHKMTYYEGSIWTVSEQLVPHESRGFRIEQWLCRFDRKFNRISTRKLQMAKVGRTVIDHAVAPEVAVAEGAVYVQSSAIHPERLLEDTLHLIRKKELAISENHASILPVRIGKRFLIASGRQHAEKEQYIFCYDRQQKQGHHIREGLNDNFYNMGKISHLQPLDIYGDTYFYCKETNESTHPLKSQNGERNLLLFLVKIKTA